MRKNSHKRSLHKKIFFQVTGLTLVAIIFISLVSNIETITNFFSSANSSLSTEAGGSYNFDCITNPQVRQSITNTPDSRGNCALLPDDDNKHLCYRQCRASRSESGLPALTNNFLKNKHLTYIKNYQPMYKATSRGGFRKGSWDQPTGYARTICSDIAANAIILISEGKPLSEFLLQTERLTSVFDDAQQAMAESTNNKEKYRGWAKLEYEAGVPKGDFWLASAAGYQCGVAASLLWDKFEPNTAWDRYIKKPNRTVAEKQQLIRTTLLNLARNVKNEYPITKFQSISSSVGSSGNSQLEETAFTSAFLAFMSQAFPVSGEEFLLPAKELANGVMTYDCGVGKDAFSRCMYDSNFEVANHGLYPQPHYGFAGVMHMAWAGMPFYQWGSMVRDSIPSEFRFLNKSVYNLVNAFEGTAKSTNFSSMQYVGSFDILQPIPELALEKTNWQDVEYQGRKGVTEWGMGPEYHAGAMTYMYINDLHNYNGYRSTSGPIAWFIKANDELMSQNKLYLAPVVGGSTIDKFRSTHKKGIVMPLNSSDREAIENTHFLLNSFKAFEHVISFLYVNDQVLLQKME